MCKLVKVSKFILNDDWHGLLMLLTTEEMEENHIAMYPENYEHEGDYEIDARHTYPNRNNLIKTVIKKVLDVINE